MLLQHIGPYVAVILFGVVVACANMSSNEMVETVQFPGTLWCGPGTSAQHYEDLGFLKFEDMCCRSHNRCSHSIKPFETKWRLTNLSPFVAMSCDCDNALLRLFSALCFNLGEIDCSSAYAFSSNNCSRLGDDITFEYAALQFLVSNLTTGNTYPNGTVIDTSMEAALVPMETSKPPTESSTPPSSSFRAREVTKAYDTDTHLIPMAPQVCCMNTPTENIIETTNDAPNYVEFTPINQPLPLAPINYPPIFKPIPLSHIPFIPRDENNYLTEFTPINQPLPFAPINHPSIFKPIPLSHIPFIPRDENNYLTKTWP